MTASRLAPCRVVSRALPTNTPAARRAAALLLTAVLAVGCAEQRTYTFVSNPRDALIKIDGVERGVGTVEQTLGFTSPARVFSVTASRFGFEDARITVLQTTPQGIVPLDLKPRSRPIQINVEPADAMVSLDGRPISDGRVTSMRYDLPFSIDEAGREQPHTLRADRQGFLPVELPLVFTEDRAQYTLRMPPVRKDVSVSTTPAGAQLTFDGTDVGPSPMVLRQQAWSYDTRREQFVPRVVVATKPGYPPTRYEVNWDDGKTDYSFPLNIFNKRVRVTTDPADAIVKIDGKVVEKDADGAYVAGLSFPPINDSGTLKDFPIEATLSRDGEIWKPATGRVGWDDGQTNYAIQLEEILIRSVAARAIEYRVKDGRWSPMLVEANTTSWKDTTDGPLGTATRITDLPAGASIASFSISPDGKRIVYALVEPDGKQQPKTRLYMCLVDGLGGSTSLTDGKHLDLTPTFNPAGDAILFSSDRGGGAMQVWSIPVDGLSGVTRLTAGNGDNLWPMIDTSPKPRIFYQALVPGQDVPRLYSTQLGTPFETDLTRDGGFQPRLSPRNDVLAFVQFNPQTQRTDVCRTGDKGGLVQKITDTPDVSERDPAWSPDGTRLAITAEVPFPDDPNRAQSEIYVVDPTGANLRAVTMNDALDDLPAWSPTDEAVYFRSNRGGKWDIWRIPVK